MKNIFISKKKKIFLTLSKTGFTLIETVIYVAIISMMITSVVAYSLSLSADSNKNYVIQSVQANSRSILNVLNNKIHTAAAVLIPEPGVSSNQLVIDIPGEASSTTFFILGSRLVMKENGGPNVYLSDQRVKVSDLIFSNDSQEGKRATINIQAKVSYFTPTNNLENRYAQNIQSVVTIRK